MSGFDKDWLELREPADMQSRSDVLLDHAVRHVDALPQPHIVMDIGCGTGSTYRTLSSRLPGIRWKLLDYEPALLDEAKRRIGPVNNVEFHCQDLNRLDEALLEGVAMVTASALFDLCSADFCDRFVKRIASRNIGLYAALNYNGVMEWSVPHPLDAKVVEDFNRHQRSDKGFGQALGPDASEHLSALCEASGMVTQTGDSPWRLGPESAKLQKEFLKGLYAPIRDIGEIDETEFQQWMEFRLSHADREGSLCIVGHTDVLALPRT